MKTLNKNTQINYAFWSFISLVIFSTIAYFADYIETEGICPTDEGVILSQAFRIFNGEIPHRDFIDVRPSLSCFIHSVYFFFDFPVVPASRWGVLIEYFLFSAFVSVLACRLFSVKFSDKKVTILFFLSMLWLCFLLNLNNHTLFPWTTVDAVFLSIIGFFFLFQLFYSKGVKSIFMTFFSLFSASSAVLARQSFVFVALVVFCIAAFFWVKQKKSSGVLVSILSAGIPLILYVIYLYTHNALPQFIEQMTGRTELFSTAVIRFIKSFIKARLFVIYLILLGILIYWGGYFVKNGKQQTFNFIKNKTKQYSSLIFYISLIFLLLTISYSYNFFFIVDRMYLNNPFEFFWINIFVGIYVVILGFANLKQRFFIGLIFLLSWTSSISLGSNSPVYITGVLAMCNVVLLFYLMQKTKPDFTQKIPLKYQKAGLLLFLVSFFCVSFYGQKKVNYKEQSAWNLKNNLGTLFKNYGSIKTNDRTFAYYKDLRKIIDTIPDIKNNFVIAPNGAVTYPLINSRNPFPVDWLQRDEYVGNESYFYKKIDSVISQRQIYILLEKVNSSKLAFTLEKRNYEFDLKNYSEDVFVKKYCIDKYDYVAYLKDKCDTLPIKSNYFMVLKTKKQK